MGALRVGALDLTDDPENIAPDCQSSRRAWETSSESMFCPSIKWGDSNGGNSNSTTSLTMFSLPRRRRLKPLARDFGLKDLRLTDLIVTRSV